MFFASPRLTALLQVMDKKFIAIKKTPITMTKTSIKSNKCSQCDYVSAYHLKGHLKTHSGEKSHKCNQCDFAAFQAGNLKTHMKI